MKILVNKTIRNIREGDPFYSFFKKNKFITEENEETPMDTEISNEQIDTQAFVD